MIEDSLNIIGILKAIVFWFGEILGLKVNDNKSKFLPITNSTCISREKGLWECVTASCPETYLGAPLGAGYKSKQVWDKLLERLRNRLATWKRKYLTKGGRLVLIKSTLASMPVYLLPSLQF